MTNYRESLFAEEKICWGIEPSDSAIIAKDLFLEKNIVNILIPGSGYGRNAKIFLDNGIKVQGIEISKTAIELAEKNDMKFPVHHGSVNEMPFDRVHYDGVFCYALLHLLNKYERTKFLKNCFDQLCPGGYLIFTVISVESEIYATGIKISKNRYKIGRNLNVYFYNKKLVLKEFQKYGLIEYFRIDEPIKFKEGEKPIPCYLIICKK